MAIVDTSTEYGKRVQRRLASETVIWLITVGHESGSPQPNPVWFVDTGNEEILIYSLNHAARVRNVEAHPEVALHFNATADGGDVVIFRGEARIDRDAPAPADNEPYLEKYGSGIDSLGLTPETFGEKYGVPVRVRLTHVRGF